MCIHPEHQPLSKSEEGQVYWCENCKTFTVVFHTSCMLFKPGDYERFITLLHSFGSADFKYTIGADKKVLLKNNNSTVGLSLSKAESIKLFDLMSDAQLIHQANQLLSQGG